MKKRILSLFLVLCMVFSMLPQAVFAAEKMAGGTFGDGLTWSLDDEGTLTISGIGEMNEAPWLDYQYDINRVIISEGITNISDQAFYDCTNLQTVSIPGSVTSIGYSAFCSCTNLAEVQFSEGLVTIGEDAFNGCTSLARVVLPASVTEIGNGAFSSCMTLADITLPEGLRSIKYNTFAGCIALPSIVIPDSVIEIGEAAFHLCTSLASVNIPDGVTQIGDRAFSDCSSLAGIDLPDGLTGIGGSSFYGCENLKRITIPTSVTSIGEDTFGASGLKQIVFEGSAPTIAEYAFNSVYPTVFYPSGDATWNDETMLDYGGILTWTDISVASIEVEDLSVIQGAKGYETSDYIHATGEFSDPYFYYQYDPNITVTLTDGTVHEGYSGWVYIDDLSAEMVYEDGQNHKAPWGVGSHEVTAYLGTAQTTFTVTVTENPVDRIEVDPITLCENCEGYWDGYWDDELGEWIDDAWFRYHTNPETITVYYKDGTNQTYAVNEIEWLTGYGVSSGDDQDYTNQWGVGTHTATAEYMGVTCEYQVIIEESPVERIEVEPITLQELCDGYWSGYWDDELGEWIDEAWFCYNTTPETVTVWYKNGTEQTYSAYEIEELTGYGISVRDDQDYANQWGPGTHTVTASYMGVTCAYQVIIEENPVERIEVEPITLWELCNGYWNGYWDDSGEWIDDAWFRYLVSPETITVYYKDGTNQTYAVDEIETLTGYDVASHDDQGESALWGVGTHTATAEYRGIRCEYQVTILENPVSGVELIRMPDKSTFRVGEQIDLKGAVLRVHYSDGTHEDVEIDHSTYYLNTLCGFRVEKLSVEANISLSAYVFGTPGTHSVNMRLFGFECSCEVEIVESTISEISIQSDNERDLRIIATHADGTTSQMQVLWFEANRGDGDEDYVMAGGPLVTDQCCFEAEFYQMSDGRFYLNACLGAGGTELQSNTLDVCGWPAWQEQIINYIFSIRACNGSGDCFTGELNADNIDALIDVARCYGAKYKSFGDDEISMDPTYEDEYCIYTGDEIRAALEAVFGFEDADLSLSSHYDLAADVYTAFGDGWGTGSYEIPPVIEQKDGFWQVTVANCDGVNLRILLDDANRIKAYYLYDADHTHVYTETVTAPTCTEGGYTTHTCICGESYTDNSTEPLGHDPQDGVCTRCGEQMGPVASGYTGNLEWVLEWDGTLTISGSGAMKNYTYKSEMPWYSWLDQITNVVLEKGVATIGDYAFYGMPNLRTITIAQTVTVIGNYAFKNAAVLDGVELPTGLTRLGESAFYGCTSLTAIEIPASLWTVQPYTFKNCTGLEQVTFREGNLQKIADAAFYNTALRSVTLPDCLDILDVYVFKNCASLESVTLGASLTELREAVFYGTAVDALEIPEGVTRIGPYAFKNCTALEYVTLPESLLSVGEAAFYACTGLKSLILPDAVRTIGNYAFRKCAALRTVVFPEKLVTIGESSFYGCTALTKLAIPDQVSAIGAYAFKGCTAVTSVSLPDSLVIIGDSAFHTCNGISAITIPAKVTAVGEYCFSGSTNLKTITFEGDAPVIGTGAFNKLTATACYPGDNATWTSAVMQNYGGTITWQAS